MGVGRYHGQIKAIIALREPPAVELLDPDQQALVYIHTQFGITYAVSARECVQYAEDPIIIMLCTGAIFSCMPHVLQDILTHVCMLNACLSTQKQQHSEQGRLHKSRLEFRQM